MRILLPILLIAVPALQADGLSSLKEQLGRLGGNAPVKGSLELKTWSKAGKGKEMEEHQGSGSVWVEDGPQGLRLVWPKALIQQLEQEARQEDRDPKAKSPLATALAEARPTAVLRQVNAAGPLLRTLERAKLLEEKRDTWNGQPALLLTLEPSPKPMKEDERKRIKKYEARLQVWVGEGGVPLASRETTDMKASVMMMSIENHGETTATYARIGDRLVLTRREKKETNALPMVGEVLTHAVTTFTAQ